MNFLQLVNQTRTECGVSGPALGTLAGITALEPNRIIGWVAAAWTEIQLLHQEWQFMLKDTVFNLVAHQQRYVPTSDLSITDFANWKKDSFRTSSVGASYADEMLFNYMPYGVFRNLYMYGNMRSVYNRPVVWSFDQNKNFMVGAIPDQAYVVDGQYYSQPVTLAADGDTPSMPSQFHMAIVYKAMQKYAGFEAAPEVMDRATREYTAIYNQLLIQQLPTIGFGAPLA